jgi:disulfide bond formation protein DsbB
MSATAGRRLLFGGFGLRIGILIGIGLLAFSVSALTAAYPTFAHVVFTDRTVGVDFAGSQ